VRVYVCVRVHVGVGVCVRACTGAHRTCFLKIHLFLGNMLKCVARRCRVLQCVLVRCSALQTEFSTLQTAHEPLVD